MKEEHARFLTKNCNRLKNGECHNMGCLRRGQYNSYERPIKYDKATCVSYEIYQELKGRGE